MRGGRPAGTVAVRQDEAAKQDACDHALDLAEGPHEESACCLVELEILRPIEKSGQHFVLGGVVARAAGRNLEVHLQRKLAEQIHRYPVHREDAEGDEGDEVTVEAGHSWMCVVSCVW